MRTPRHSPPYAEMPACCRHLGTHRRAETWWRTEAETSGPHHRVMDLVGSSGAFAIVTVPRPWVNGERGPVWRVRLTRRGQGLRSLRDHAVLPVLDQACVSAGLFLASVTLAHFAGPQEFGAFAVAVSIVVLVGVVQGALVTRPLLVVGNLLQGRDREQYLSSLSFVQLALGVATTITASLGLAAWQIATASVDVYYILAVAALVAAYQAREYERFLCLSGLNVGGAVARALSYAVSVGGLVGGIVLIDVTWLTSKTALLAVAAASGIGFAPHFAAVFKGERPPVRPSLVAFRRNLEYSKWELFGSVSNYAYIGLVPVLLGLQGKMVDAGGYAACRTVLGPVQVAIFGAFNALVPATTALRRIDGLRSTRHATTVLCLLLVMALPPLALGAFAPGGLLIALYGPEFFPFATTLRILAAYLAVSCFTVTVHGILLSRQNPCAKGVSQFVGMVAGLAFMLTHFATLTSSGAALGTLIAEGMTLAGATVLLLGTRDESPLVRRISVGTDD